MTKADRIYDQAYDQGSADGYAGNQGNAPAYDADAGDDARLARRAYLEGFEEGQAAYRRTLEPAPRSQPLPRARR